MICKRCQQDIPRIPAYKVPPPQRGWRYKDHSGRNWSGRVCPSCRANERRTVEVDGEFVYDDFNPDPLTNRLCKKCNKPLPKSKYFRHEECAVKGIMDVWEM